MPDVKIQPDLWNGLKTAAAKQGQRPEALANRALKEFLQRLADEDFIAQSQRVARRAPLRVRDTEQAIRDYRKGK
jgi:hypothetical protein